MSIGNLPGLDVPVEIGRDRFTRRQVKEGYNPQTDDAFAVANLDFARDCLRAQGCVRGFVFPDSQMAAVERAAIIYSDCLPEDHPLKREHLPEDIRNYLAAARLYHFGMPNMPAYVDD